MEQSNRGSRMRSIRLGGALALVLTLVASGARVSLPQAASSTELDPAVLLRYLSATIGWYRHLDLQRQLVTDADEGMVVADNQQIANQAVSLAFEFARAQAETIEKEEAAARGEAGSSRYQALRQMLARLDQQVRSNQAELEALRQQLSGAAGRERESLQTRMAETRSQLELAQVRTGLAPQHDRVSSAVRAPTGWAPPGSARRSRPWRGRSPRPRDSRRPSRRAPPPTNRRMRAWPRAGRRARPPASGH